MKRRVILLGPILALLAGAAAWAWPRPADAGPILRNVAMGYIPSALAVDTRTARVFAIAARGSTSSILDARDGSVLGSIPVHGTAAAVDEGAGTVLVVDNAGVTVLDAATGRVLHTVAIAVNPTAIAVDPRTGRAFVVDPGSDAVLMLDTRTGATLRAMKTLLTPTTVAVDARADRVLVSTDSPFVSVFDAWSGAPLRTLVMRAAPGALAVDSSASGSERDRQAIVATNAGAAALDATSGTLRWSTALGGSPAGVAVDAARARAYIPTYANAPCYALNTAAGATMSVLDTHTGAVLKSIPIGCGPTAVAVDAATARVFVATGPAATVEPDRWGWLPGWLRERLPFLPSPGPQVHATPPGVAVLAAS